MVRRWARWGFTFLRTLAQCSQKWRRRSKVTPRWDPSPPCRHSNGGVLGVSISLCGPRTSAQDQRLGLWSRDPHLPAARPPDHGVGRLPCSSPCDDQAAPCAEGRRVARISDGRGKYRKFRTISGLQPGRELVPAGFSCSPNDSLKRHSTFQYLT